MSGPRWWRRCRSCARAARSPRRPPRPARWWRWPAASVAGARGYAESSRRISACCSGVIMTHLWGHAADRPGRWKEPRALAATDRAAQRARQGRAALIDPSTCQRAVCGTVPGGGKSAPSRARDRRADDPGDRGGLPDWPDGGGGRPAPIGGGPPCDTPASNTRGRDRTRRRSRRSDCTADTFSGEAACPQRRSSDTLQLDTYVTLVAQREATGSVCRSIEAVTEGLEVEGPDPHLACHERQLTRPARPSRRGRGR